MPGTVTSMPNSGLPVTIARAVDAADRLADDLVVLRVLQRHGLQVRRRQLRGRAGELRRRSRCLPLVLCVHDARGGRRTRSRARPSLRRGA